MSCNNLTQQRKYNIIWGKKDNFFRFPGEVVTLQKPNFCYWTSVKQFIFLDCFQKLLHSVHSREEKPETLL